MNIAVYLPDLRRGAKTRRNREHGLSNPHKPHKVSTLIRL